MIRERRLVAGIESFYSDDVVMIEGGGGTTSGKAANRDREHDFQEALTS